MADRETFPRDVEEARLDLELTRQELGQTTQALAEKVTDTARTTQRFALATSIGVMVGMVTVLVIRQVLNRSRIPAKPARARYWSGWR
ncbi:DUF3618 domain-containing protein [Amycolatopsis cynarae]|uniref:DUF3618 domain-containing protein n=1 Tax=Amycolatopsis cynarae TaxID=2995223 RepID=A0ABY7AUI0_9PSEU|nr:DUF3618 domain-containing protein [Amycolatopsis sp. HUAS 11-8]WAL63600.1 DUF3618 domain-containing protein [Amycolatopsis sp. HUAS 11-8]